MDDRYRLDQRIAAGGVGQVWLATDLLLERPVAVKVLRPEYADHPETLERFRKEAKNAGALNNSHVAQVYDYGHAGPGGSPYLVMEFVDGPSLADVLVVDPIDPVRALDVIAQAADGLAAAHKAGVIHRDIKPGNILISREGHVKVTDFGIAHAVGQAPVTGPGLVMGTSQYMAPERIAGIPGTAASDLYALGIVLHECLTGMPPHDGTPAEVMAAHLYLPLPPLPAGVPPELDVLVDRLTVKDPAKRIGDARELADLAARLRDSLGSGATTPPARPAVLTAPTTFPAPGTQETAFGFEPPVWSGGEDAGPGTSVLISPDHRLGAPSTPDEWTEPQRLPPGGPPGGAGQPRQWQPDDPPVHRRRRAGALALGAGVLVSAGLVALLVSGAFNGAPAANQLHTGPSTTEPTQGQVPSHGASAPGRAAIPSTGVTPIVTGTHPAKGTTTPSRKSSAHPSGGTTSSSTPGGSSGPPSGSPSSGSPSTSPSGPSSTTPGGTPSTSAPACFLVCL